MAPQSVSLQLLTTLNNSLLFLSFLSLLYITLLYSFLLTLSSVIFVSHFLPIFSSLTDFISISFYPSYFPSYINLLILTFIPFPPYISLSLKHHGHSYLEYSLDPSKVRSQDTTSVIAYVAANVYGRYLTWNFVRNNWDIFLERWVWPLAALHSTAALDIKVTICLSPTGMVEAPLASHD